MRWFKVSTTTSRFADTLSFQNADNTFDFAEPGQDAIMNKRSLPIVLSFGALMLAGCTSGTTYGTGVSHEEQTFSGLSKMFSITPDKGEKIDYSARPDLVMPANKQALPAPGSGLEQTAGDQVWPETPEQRIAAVRQDAPEPNWRSGDLPTEYLTSKKQGIANSSGLYAASRENGRAGGGEQIITEIRRDKEVSKEVALRREQLSYSTGVKRKFLTEPPTEYRTPAATADAGDLGITKEQLTERQKREERERIDASNGVITPGS